MQELKGKFAYTGHIIYLHKFLIGFTSVQDGTLEIKGTAFISQSAFKIDVRMYSVHLCEHRD